MTNLRRKGKGGYDISTKPTGHSPQYPLSPDSPFLNPTHAAALRSVDAQYRINLVRWACVNCGP